MRRSDGSRLSVIHIGSMLLMVFDATTLAIAQERPANSEEILTNEAIVEMVKSGLGTNLIVQAIETHPGKYSLSYTDLISLKRQGVPETVISAMLSKQRAAATEAPANMAEGGWDVRDVPDRMTDRKSFEAVMSQSVVGTEQKGELQVQAKCNAERVDFLIAFLPASDSRIGFKQNWYGDTFVPGGILGLAVATLRHQKPWVEMRVRIDKDPPIAVSSESDYTNYAGVGFTRSSVQRAMAAVDAPPGDFNKQILNFAGLYAAFKSAGTIDQAFKAHSILVELTLANDEKSILEIKPQEPSFQKFVSRCNAEFPATRAPAPPGPQFSGTVDEFAAAFPGFLQRAVLARGLDPRNYEKEAGFIVGAVRTCAQIPPQMVSSVTDPYRRVHFEKLGEQYRICQHGGNISYQVKQNVDRVNPNVWLSFTPSRDRVKAGTSLTVTLMGGQTSDTDATSLPTWSVVAATIQ